MKLLIKLKKKIIKKKLKNFKFKKNLSSKLLEQTFPSESLEYCLFRH